jgi:CelD/BcsL family acetyltransferase involved in cellulose biosynthesis
MLQPKELANIMDKTSLKVERIHTIDALNTISKEWNALLEQNDTKTIELTYDWQITYWKHFNEDAELFVLLIWEADSLVAISPLKLTNKKVAGLKIRYLELIAAQTSNYQDLIIGKNSEDIIRCIFNYLVLNQGSWDVLSLRHIPEKSTTALFISECLDDFSFRRITEVQKCIYLKLDNTWEEHKKSLGKDRKHRMANRVRRIEREVGKIQLKASVTEEQFHTDLQQFFRLHRKRWNQTSTPSEFMDERYCKFYLEVGIQLFSKGQLGLSVLEAGETTLAQLLFFACGKNYLIQLIAYDPDYYPYSPMLVLQELFVEDTLAKGAEIIDWGTYYSWKELWANQFKNRVNLYLFPKKITPHIIYFFMKNYIVLRTHLRKYPLLFNLIKALRGKLRPSYAVSKPNV